MVKNANNIKTIDSSDLVKKVDYDTNIYQMENKILDHNHDKHITCQECNKLTANNFLARLKQASPGSKNDFSKIINNFDLDKKIETLATKAELKAEKKKIKS